jgi:hypothetical protein
LFTSRTAARGCASTTGSSREVGEEITDGGQRYRIDRSEEKTTRGGFHHAWAVLPE